MQSCWRGRPFLIDLVCLGLREKHQLVSRFSGRGSPALKGSLCSFLVRKRVATVMIPVLIAYFDGAPPT